MPTQVVAALVWRQDRFLICQRPAHKARGLLWEFVGGKVEPGETKEEALARECREELDAKVCAGEVFMQLVHQYPDLTVELTLFHATMEGEPRLLEHNDIRWITVEEIDNYDFCPADTEILAALKQKKTSVN
ncbi:MAG: (deoxy)nucleoside triphosphate pyrophosphohydrolase [Oscillospiraceae bacterium]|nr:(deoxy)nucleoside triphosphate pyrophosphohydrolase [Oscillospiraceae bacterium]